MGSEKDKILKDECPIILQIMFSQSTGKCQQKQASWDNELSQTNVTFEVPNIKIRAHCTPSSNK